MFKRKMNFNNHSFFLICFLAFACLILNTQSAHGQDGSLELTLDDAILMALENNSGLKVERLRPELSRNQEQQEQAVFDLEMSNTITTSGTIGESDDGDGHTSVDLGVSKKLPTGGDVGFGLTTDRNGGGVSGEQYSTRIGLSLSHPLFKGAGTAVNLSRLHKAELNTKTSLYELQGYAESLVAQVETTYWDYALAQRQLGIYEDSLSLAERQLQETQVLVDVGKIAEVELVGSRAEVASRKEALINARSNLATIRFRLLRLINPPGADFWNHEIVIIDELAIPEFDVGDIESHMEIALQKRPDLNEAKLLLERNELDIITTKNGLLPNMELFITLGMTGYSDSFGDSITGISGNNNDFRMGINYTYTFGRKDSRARYRNSIITQEQGVEAVDNLVQLAQEDVGVAWIEANRTTEQIAATSASRLLQEEKLRAETEKYRVGKSTSLLVAQAQRDLLVSQIAEIQAIANYQKSLVGLFRNEGTLLQWHGISLMEQEAGN